MSFVEPVYDFKEGDRVAYFYRGELVGARTITKITPTGVIRTNKTDSFRQGSGQLISGEAYHHGHIQPFTDELRNQLTHMRASNLLNKYDFGKLSLAKLRAIMAIIDGGEPA